MYGANAWEYCHGRKVKPYRSGQGHAPLLTPGLRLLATYIYIMEVTRWSYLSISAFFHPCAFLENGRGDSDANFCFKTRKQSTSVSTAKIQANLIWWPTDFGITIYQRYKPVLLIIRPEVVMQIAAMAYASTHDTWINISNMENGKAVLLIKNNSYRRFGDAISITSERKGLVWEGSLKSKA